jgi:release factor glutamine methyltransferase
VPDEAIPREPEVRDHDPGLALYGGPDGLMVVRPLAEQAAMLLRPGGLVLVEHADVQGEDAGESGVPAVLRAQRDPDQSDPGPAWRDVIDHLDLAGRPRHTSALRETGRMAP